MDLLHGNLNEEVEGPWNEIKYDTPQIQRKAAKVKVKLSDDSEKFAYYYDDKCSWISIYGQKTSYFWCCATKEPLYNVSYWKYLKEKE